MQLREYQLEAVEAVYRHLREREDNPCVVLPTGCHAADHPILMFDGTIKPVQDVVAGDLLMGPDSQPRQVLSLCRGDGNLFKIIPHRGEPFIVNEDHILSLVCTNEGKQFPCSKRGGETETISLKDYLLKAKSWRHLRKLYHMSVEFPSKASLAIPPYILGLLLGDGHLGSDATNLTTADESNAEAWADYARSIGCDISVKDGGGRCPTYALVKTEGKCNILNNALDAYGLAGLNAGTKFIPQVYLTASRQDRLALFAGLMDSDGYASKSGCDYMTKSKELATDIMFLARSLGFAVKCVEKYCSCQTGAGGWFFRLSIWGDFDDVPCRLERRKPAQRRQKKSALRTGFQIEPCGHGKYYGFLLDQDHLYLDGLFMVHHNSGKTPVISQIARDAVVQWRGRVLILAHVKELLEQAVDKLQRLCPDLMVGVHSAGLKSRDTLSPVIVAGIQSVYKKACELGAFNLIIIDEAHLIPPDGEGMYRTFLADARTVNPNVRLIGFTATPYRMNSGVICDPDNLLNHVCYEIGVKELIAKGYLCPLVTKAGRAEADASKLHIRGREFIASETEELMDEETLVKTACFEIASLTKDRKSCLVFCAGVKHAEHVARTLRDYGGTVECVFGDTLPGLRAQYIEEFRQGRFKHLVNVNVLTTGFDAPNVDCVVLLRPTNSPGLFYQQCGRGFRLHPGKRDCLVLDFGGNVMRHGPVDTISVRSKSGGSGEAPAKKCPDCLSVIHAAYQKCPDCGHEFPPPEKERHDRSATSAGIISGQTDYTEYDVEDVLYSVHTKRGSGEEAPQTMRVDYCVGWQQFKSEWVCPEHTGYVRGKFEAWWRRRAPWNLPPPCTASEAVRLAEEGVLAKPLKITVKSVAGEKFDRIVAYKLGEMPAAPESVESEEELDAVPF